MGKRGGDQFEFSLPTQPPFSLILFEGDKERGGRDDQFGRSGKINCSVEEKATQEETEKYMRRPFLQLIRRGFLGSTLCVCVLKKRGKGGWGGVRKMTIGPSSSSFHPRIWGERPGGPTHSFPLFSPEPQRSPPPLPLTLVRVWNCVKVGWGEERDPNFTLLLRRSLSQKHNYVNLKKKVLTH